MSNYANKKELHDIKDVIALTDYVDKLDISKVVNVLVGLNDSKAKGNDLDVDRLKFFLWIWKKWCSQWKGCKKDSVQETRYKSK